MACGECESGNFGCGCCCASVTNLKGGIHPDSVVSVSMDLVLDQVEGTLTQTHRTETLLNDPVHIVGVNASLVAVQRLTSEANLDKQLQEPSSGGVSNVVRATPSSVSLYTVPGYVQADLNKGGFNPLDDQEQSRRYFCTASLTSMMPTFEARDDIFGFFADGGLYVEFNSPSPDYGIRLVVRYVPRLQFSPAYHDPLTVMQHYWKCSRKDEEFLEGFYGGTAADIPSEDTDGTQQRTSVSPETTGRSWSQISIQSDATWESGP
tara:strand:+ start:1830 stop:2621 length:792 start_codon:yes stop_codon:yes gene_type:complete